MNMIGHPKHIAKALAAGVDIICAQGGEGGGHTGDVPFSVSIDLYSGSFTLSSLRTNSSKSYFR